MTQQVQHDPVLYKFLNGTNIKDIPQIHDQNLLVIDAQSSMKEAFELLTSHKITAAPVFDKNEEQYLGIVDMKDYVAYILWLFSADNEKLKNIPTKAQEIANVCKQNPFIPIFEDSSLGHLLKEFGTRGLHRMPVVSKQSPLKVKAMITQSAVIQFLSENHKNLGALANKSISELQVGGLGTKKGVVQVSTERTLLDVFYCLQKYNIYGCAVVDENGKLSGNISVTDLQNTLEENIEFLSGSAGKFVKEKLNQTKTIACSETETLVSVIDLLAKSKVHRVYVVDKENIPVGVITLTDIMDCILSLATGIEKSPV